VRILPPLDDPSPRRSPSPSSSYVHFGRESAASAARRNHEGFTNASAAADIDCGLPALDIWRRKEVPTKSPEQYGSDPTLRMR
jgi:hypothetical protein